MNTQRISPEQWTGSRFELFGLPSWLRRAAIGALVAMMIFSLAGCGGAGSAPPPPPPNPIPSVANGSLSPSSAVAGAVGFTLTVNGSNFISSSVVQWNGSTRPTTFVSSMTLQGSISSADVATAGMAMVTVTTPAPGGGTSAALNFTIDNPMPAISSLGPAAAIAGGAAFVLTVTGTNFVATSVVEWNGSSRATTFTSGTSLQASISAADIAAAGMATVTVSSPAPGGGTSSALNFTVNNPVPTVASLGPGAAFAGDPDFTLTVTGTNFVVTSTVQWNGSPRTTTFVSSAALQAAITAADIATVGTATVAVVNPAPGGGTSGALNFSIKVPPPKITLLNPSSALAGGASFMMTVTGKNFVPSSIVQWKGTALTTTFVSSTTLQAAVDSSNIAAIGAANVTVSNPPANGGLSAPSTFFVGSVGGANFAVISVNQPAKDIVWDPVNAVFYLSVTGAAATNANTICVLDPATATITSALPVGSNPRALAISDDSQFLYAGIDGAGTVQRFTLPGLKPDISYSLGGSPFYALDLQVAPGLAHTTAVTIGDATVNPAAEGGLAVFDDASMRPTKAPGFGGTGNLFDTIQWGSDATAIYAANNEDSAANFYALSVNASGVTLAKDYPNTVSPTRIHFDKGKKLIYADGGLVLDPTTGLPAGNFNLQHAMVPDSSLNVAFIVPSYTTGSNSITLDSFDLTHFTPIGSITIPNVTADALRVIRWGQNGLAFITGSFTTPGEIYLVGGNFVSSAPPFVSTSPPAVTPPPAPTANAPAIASLNPSSGLAGGMAFVLTLNGSGFDPAAVVHFNGTALATSFISSTQLHANVTAANLASPGAASITVFNPAGSGGPSAPSSFFVGTAAGTSTTGAGFAAAVLNQEARDLVFDASHNEIFVSVSNDVANGNVIAALDLGTANVVGTQFAGSSPDLLRVSDDDQFLYAGIRGSGSIQRFTLPTLNPDIGYSLGTASGGPFYAFDFQVAPGAPHTTAVTLAVTSSSPNAQGGVAIFDDTTSRPTTTPGFGGTGHLFDTLQWGSDATALFAANYEDDGFDFYTLAVNANGVTLANDYLHTFVSFNNRIHFDSVTKLIYANDGSIVNPATGAVVGTFGTGGAMIPDGTLNMAFFVTPGVVGGTAMIQAFNLTTRAAIGSITISNVIGNPLKLIRWGQNGLAFNTDAGQLVLIGGNFIH